MKKILFCLLIVVLSTQVLSCSSKQLILIDDYQYKRKQKLTIFLVRHAEAYKNVPEDERPQNLPKAKLDSLTPKGDAQSLRLGKFFKDKKITAVIASPTGRTRQTAEAIVQSAPLASSVLIYPEFKPLKSGTTSDGKKADWNWRLAQWKAGNDPTPTGGENLSEGTTRAVNAIHLLLKEYRNQSVVIISHGDIIATLIGQAAETPLLERCYKHMVAGGSVSELVFHSDKTWKLLSQSQSVP